MSAMKTVNPRMASPNFAMAAALLYSVPFFPTKPTDSRQTHTLSHTCTLTHMYMYTHSHTHTLTHMYTHTLTHMYTHTLIH